MRRGRSDRAAELTSGHAPVAAMTLANRTRAVHLMTLGILSAAAGAAAPEAGVRAMEASLLKGQAALALDAAARAEPLLRPGADLDYVRCVTRRFNTVPEWDRDLDPFVAEIVVLYQRYWHASFLDQGAEREHEARLERSLKGLLAMRPGEGGESVDAALSRELAKRGHFVLLGRTPPFRELMIWKKQTPRTFDVALPEGRHAAQVFLLDEFESFGWASWATCEHRATGGWATETALFAPLPRYRSGIEGNEFQSVFLAHETQHLADKRQFKNLQPWELEYRAKLAELWASDPVVMADRLAKFTEGQSDDPTHAHAHANRAVISDLQRSLGKMLSIATPGEVQLAAKALLGADSGRRRAKDRAQQACDTRPNCSG